jgi:hypothetical protein
VRPALELLAELASRGVTARLAGPETLVLSPPERLPSGLLMRLRAAKPAVLAEVQARVAARDQVLVDAFDRLAVMYQAIPAPRPAPQPAEADPLWDRLAEAGCCAAPGPFEAALVAYTEAVEASFVEHLLGLADRANIILSVVDDGEGVHLRAEARLGADVPPALIPVFRRYQRLLLAALPQPPARGRR